jgi:uncharacterized protein
MEGITRTKGSCIGGILSAVRQRCLCVAIVLVACCCAFAGAAQSRSTTEVSTRVGQEAESASCGERKTGVNLSWGVRVEMRDGVHLNATVYRPCTQSEPLPVIFVMTPYVADHDHSRGMYFAKNGYVFALVDVRGRGNSEGEFETGPREGSDGYDTVEWFAKQPWCNGKVAMWGGSYMGFVQWTTIKELPPHLMTIVPASPSHQGMDFPETGGIFTSDDMSWLAMTSGKALNRNLSADGDFWDDKYHEIYSAHLPFRRLEEISGFSGTAFQKWLAHPAYDSYWKAMAPTPEQYARLKVPILTIAGGYFDGNQGGAMSYYREHMQYGTPTGKQSHYLIIGPWDHAGTRTPNTNVAGLTFGQASMLDLNNLHKQWYDWTLKNGPKPDFLKKRVAYYVSGPGAEIWKYADDLQSIVSENRKLYLAGNNGQASDVFHAGSLSSTMRGSAPDRYVYDPLSIDAVREPEDFTDQRAILQMKNNGLVYSSEPLPEALEISGYVKLTLWLAMDVPDTDFHVTLYDVLPDGSSIVLAHEYLRARYRESFEKEKLVVPGEITRYEFTGFNWFSRRIEKGSRLRLFVTCPNDKDLEKNYNSGGVVADESGKDARTAHITLYHDSQHQSVLELPIGR